MALTRYKSRVSFGENVSYDFLVGSGFVDVAEEGSCGIARGYFADKHARLLCRSQLQKTCCILINWQHFYTSSQVWLRMVKSFNNYILGYES